MKRRDALAALLAVSLPLGASRLNAQTRRRIGYLLFPPLVNPPSSERRAFLEGLRELGYSGGAELHIEYRSANHDRAKLRPLAEELVQAKVELIVATSTPAARAAAEATRSVPIVMAGVGDAKEAKLVNNYARPEANVTGMTWNTIELAGKRFELLREALPRAERVALLLNPEDEMAGHLRRASLEVSKQMGFQTTEHRITNPGSLLAAFDQLARARPDAMVVLVDSLLVTYRKIIADEALKMRIPCISSYRGFVASGALMSYAADVDAIYRRAATFVHRLLSGATPAELPVEQPLRYQLTINRTTARALELSLPASLLLLADELID